MRFRHALVVLPTALLVVSSATATGPKAASTVNISVSNGSTHYNQHVVAAKPGLLQINFTNNSTAPHNVSLEHNGEYEYGATLTIRKGATVTFLTLTKGTYHLYSSVGRDEDKGMAATLVVK
jgi:plastocyanin